MNWQGVIEQYRRYLPVNEQTKVVTLLEGNTPLIPVPRFVDAIGGRFELYLKLEALNPTGSFKDRGMTLALTAAKTRGAEVVVCASTGNTSASAAAYAARAGLRAAVVLPHGKIALGKLAQALIYGARIVPIDGNFDDALNLVRALGDEPGVEIVNSINPFRIEGQKTAAFEICDALGRAPDFHFIPVGNAGNITAYWKGYKEYHAAGRVGTLPRMFGWQAAGAAPIVENRVIAQPETVATAIRIGNPASWQAAVAARDESGGVIGSVTDGEILHAYQLIAARDGIFVEPASAASLAGVIKAHAAGDLPAGSVLTATLTGHGLKDPDTAISVSDKLRPPVKPTLSAVLEVIRG
ncbi:MAG: threonine synthase [Verrucomicrobiales bacterium]|jgi:threonine synthase|nr:threonine synthase [Verrucomicrobiales bacterium]